MTDEQYEKNLAFIFKEYGPVAPHPFGKIDALMALVNQEKILPENAIQMAFEIGRREAR